MSYTFFIYRFGRNVTTEGIVKQCLGRQLQTRPVFPENCSHLGRGGGQKLDDKHVFSMGKKEGWLCTFEEGQLKVRMHEGTRYKMR